MQDAVRGGDSAAVKKSIRDELVGRRTRLSGEEVLSLSARVARRFISTPEYSLSRKLALYASFRNEVLTGGVFEDAIKSGREVYYPRVVKSGPHLAFFRVDSEKELELGSYEILEPPAHASECPASDFDCVVVPGAAFDLRGARVGYGRGYYDKALKNVKKPIVAFAFDFQVVEGEIVTEAHDVSVSAIVTEKRVIRVS